MLTAEKKKVLWEKASNEFPSDTMLRNLHFIRELMSTIKKREQYKKNYRAIALLARQEFSEWLKIHPEYNA